MFTDFGLTEIKKQLLSDIESRNREIEHLVQTNAQIEADIHVLESNIAIYEKMLVFFNMKNEN